MSWFDLLLVVSLAGFVWGGFTTGLIQTIGGIIGLFFGPLLAARLYEPFGKWLEPLFNNSPNAAKITAFIILFLLIARLIGLAFSLVNRMFNFIAIVPGLKFLNRLGGAVLGFLQGALFIGIILQFAVRLPLAESAAQAINASEIARVLLAITGWLVPLFPAAIKQSEQVLNRFLPR